MDLIGVPLHDPEDRQMTQPALAKGMGMVTPNGRE